MSQNIFIISPSSPFKGLNKDLERGKEELKKIGFEVFFGKNCFKNAGNTAGTISERLEDIHEAFTNPKYDLVMSTQGGFNSNELLPHLDFELIKKYPKPFVGMSDLTTLGLNLYQKSQIQTFYGLQFRHFCDSQNTCFEQFSEVIKNPNTIQKTLQNQIKPENIFRKGESKSRMEGKLIGGNLAVLCWLLGTDYSFINLENSILFFEDDEETYGNYWQMYLTHLKQAGVFEKIKGVIFGKILPNTKFNPKSDFKNILDIVFKDYNFPILTEMDFGHTQLPTTIPYGTSVKLNL